MSDTQPALDLTALESDYDIVGELGTRGDARLFMGTRRQSSSKRKDDDPRVLVSIVSTPRGDEGNALAHLASDTKQLSALTHRRLVPIIEGKWLGKDSYAVISQRTNDGTLAEAISRRESFSSPRIAAILREVNGIIEWARDQQIVHRTVTTDGVFLEPRTDRVRVFFSVEPLHRIRPASVPEDARTIARLAMAMFTGNEDPNVDDAKKLAEARDDLPEQLGEATAALLDDKSAATAKDVSSYLSLIGMADPLAAGESERERIRAEITEEVRVEREKLAAERANFEHLMASERGTFEHHMAAERAQFAHEMETLRNTFARESAEAHAAFERELAETRAKHAAQKAELQRAAEAERAALLARREELERAVAAQRAELERAARLDREQVEKLRAQIKSAGEQEVERKRNAALDEITDDTSVLDDESLSLPAYIVPVMSPLQELEFDDDNVLMKDEIESIPSVPMPVLPPQVEVSSGSSQVAIPEQQVSEGATIKPVGGGTPASGGRRWVVPAGIAAVVLVVAGAIAMVSQRSSNTPAGVVPKAATTKSVAAPVQPQPAAPVVPAVDSAATRQAAVAESVHVADSTAAARERRAARREAARRDSIAQGRARARRDSLARVRDTLTPVDTL